MAASGEIDLFLYQATSLASRVLPIPPGPTMDSRRQGRAGMASLRFQNFLHKYFEGLRLSARLRVLNLLRREVSLKFSV